MRCLTFVQCAGLCAAALTGPMVQSQTADKPSQLERIRTRETESEKQFQRFKIDLVRLAQRLERSERGEDRERAKSIQTALDVIRKDQIDVRYAKLIESISRDMDTLDKAEAGRAQQERLTQSLQEVLRILTTGAESQQLKSEIDHTTKIFEAVIAARNEQYQVTKQASDAKSKAKPSDTQAKARKTAEEVEKKISEESGSGKGTAESEAKSHVKEATARQREAEERFQKPDDRESGLTPATKAGEELDQAAHKLKKRLFQLREEERQRMLATLLARCEYLLSLQTAVREATVKSHTLSETERGILARRESEKEVLILRETEATLELLKAEGTAVVFAETFEQLCGEEKEIEAALKAGQCGASTVALEDQVIFTLNEMIGAIRESAKDRSLTVWACPSPADPRKPRAEDSPPAKRQLVNTLQELKLIRALQKGVNAKTESATESKEQSESAEARAALKRIAEAQSRLQEMMDQLHKSTR